MTETLPMEPSTAFAELGRIKLAETDLDGVLTTIAALAKRTIPNAAEVSVTLIGAGQPHTTASTGDLALRLDEVQYALGNGPCLDASESRSALRVPDMTDEPRWRQWAAEAVGAGVYSSLSIGLPVDDSATGALNVYATGLDAFDDDAVALAQTFAGYAAVALANAHVYDTAATLARHMQTAMESRAVIEQAKGILMGQRRCSPDEAFRTLRELSQHSNRKLKDVAAALVARAQQSGPA